MSAARLSMIETLVKALQAPEVYDRYFTSSIARCRANDYKRIFDGFPNFIPPAVFNKWHLQFFNSLKKSSPISSEAKVDLSFSLQDINKLQREIATYVCQELFDDKSQIKSQLINFMRWYGISPNNKRDVIEACVQLINTLLFTHKKIPAKYHRAATVIGNIINLRYPEWVSDAVGAHEKKESNKLVWLGASLAVAGMLFFGVKKIMEGGESLLEIKNKGSAP